MKKSKIIMIITTCVLLSCNPATDTKNSAGATDTVATPVKHIKTSADPVYGIDISSYQGNEVDFLTRHQDDLTFVICKATEGLNYEDPDFDANWTMIAEKGFTRGAYHFYHCKDDPLQQAAYFTSVVKSFSKSDLPPIVDFEELSIDAGCTMADIQKNLATFLNAVKKSTGRTPLIYTDNNTGNAYLNSSQFAAYPLYIADYINSDTPMLPTVWKTQAWTLWQKNDTLRIDGTTDDFDIFSGNTDSLIKFIQTH